MAIEARIAKGLAELGVAYDEILRGLRQERSRRRDVLNRRLHELRRMLDASYAYTSQAGQDAVMDRIFGGRRGLTFADIGGYDGVSGSNTLSLEQRRGWTGILVEPVPSELAKAREVRRCPCLPFAIAAADGEAEFLEVSEGFTQMSGRAGRFDAGLLA
jgi:hypothetical protein